MTTRPALALLAAMAVAPAVLAEPPRTGLPPNGSEMFRAVLAANGFEPVTDARSRADRSEILVVAWGRDVGATLPDARAVLTDGGAALVATNTPAHLGGLGLDPVDETVAVEPPTWIGPSDLPPPPAHPFPFDRRNQDFARSLFDPPVTPPRPVRTLGTVRPAFLWTESRRWPRAVLFTAPDALPFNRDTGRREYAGVAPFAAGRRGLMFNGRGYTVVALGDHGVLTNAAFLDPAGDNWNFARNLVAALKDGRRTKCLFVENGAVVTDFTAAYYAALPPPPPLPLPSLAAVQDKLVDGFNKAVDRVQAGDGLDGKLLGRTPGQQERRYREYVAALAVSAGVWAVWYLLRKVWKARQPQDVVPPAFGGRWRRGAADTLTGRREDELLGRDNLYEPARAVARGVFREAGVGLHAGPAMPAVEYPLGPSPALSKGLADLWRVGYGPAAAVPLDRWREIAARAAEARRAAAAGVWRLAPVPSGAV